jgi:hypothetical protein
VPATAFQTGASARRLRFSTLGNPYCLPDSSRTGRPAELFLPACHVGSPLEAIARDGAIIVSLALQHGADIGTIGQALTRDHDGGLATLLGAALDAILEVVNERRG